MPERMRNQPAAPGFVEGGESVRGTGGAAQRRQLSAQEKSLLAHKDERWSTNASWLHLATRLRIRSAERAGAAGG